LSEIMEWVRRPAGAIAFFSNIELERPPAQNCTCQRNWKRGVVRLAQSFFIFFLNMIASVPPSRLVPVRENLNGASSARRNFFFLFLFLFFYF
jgi:hypothetical protein